jgi:hypothetical protein
MLREREIDLACMEDFILKSPNSLCHFQLNAKKKKKKKEEEEEKKVLDLLANTKVEKV